MHEPLNDAACAFPATTRHSLWKARSSPHRIPCWSTSSGCTPSCWLSRPLRGGRGVRRDESAPPFTRAAIGIVETPAPRSAALRTGSPRSSRWCPGSSIRDRGQGRHLLRRQPQSLGRPSPCERGSHLPGVKAGHTMRWRRLGATLDAHASQTAGGSKCPRVVDNQCQPRQHHRPVTSRQETLNSTTCWLAASQPSSGEVGA
jgi:hypothetical protein